jgi:hypothetical protein
VTKRCARCKREFSIVPGYTVSKTVCGVCLAKEGNLPLTGDVKEIHGTVPEHDHE